MKTISFTFLALSFLLCVPVHAKPKSVVAATPLYSTATTPIGTLLDNPRARAIVDRHIPNTSTDSRIYFARAMTLKTMQRFAKGQISDKQLAAVDADLAKLRR